MKESFYWALLSKSIKSLMLGLMLLASMSLYGQNQVVRFPKTGDMSIQAITELIQTQTNMSVDYTESIIASDTKIRIRKKAIKLSDLLEHMLKGHYLTYKINGRHIIIYRVEKNAIESEPSGKTIASGKVLDENGEPLVGVTVLEKGTNNGTITDQDGNFRLTMSSHDNTVTFSYIGFMPQTIKPGTNMKVRMVTESSELNEVVVIGYGTLKKKDLTGAVAAINNKAIEERHTTDISTALQGAVSGMSVTRGGGEPGSTATLRVRGVTTISTSDPLVIIDGVPGDMNSVNPDDVESISVLKDAASAAIYGSRAAAGVILITTKRAQKGELKLNYNYEYAATSPTTHPTYVHAIDYMNMTNELRYNDNPSGGKNQVYTQDLIDNYPKYMQENPDEYSDTDWYSAVFKGYAPRQTHTVSIMAGGEKARTGVSLRYDKMETIYKSGNSGREHYLARINNDFYISKFIEAHIDANFRMAKYKKPNYSLFDTESYTIPPIYPVRWKDGRFCDVKDGGNTLVKASEDAGNTKINNTHIGFKGEINFKPIDGLRISLVAAPNFSLFDNKHFVRKLGYTHLEDPNTIKGWYNATTSLSQQRNKSQNITTQALINYNKTIGHHDIALLGGFEYYYAKWDNLSASADKFELSTYPYLDLAPKDYQFVGGNAQEYSYRSWFGRINYSYSNRYLFEANIRHDGSSRFAEDNRWATFPSVSLGWLLSEENFMKQTRKWLDELKLRVSWGKLGNERIRSYYPYQASIDFGTAALMNGGSATAVTTAAQVTYAVKDISWETTTSWNIGIDAVALHNRLNFTFDIYRKKTSDMLLAVQIPMFLGYENPSVNAGDMHTNGWDFEAGWRDHCGDFNYSVKFNLSDSKSKMGNLNGTIFYSGNCISREGTEYMQYYGYKCKGIYQTQEQVENSARLNKNITVGDLQYEDISGPDDKPDGIISAEYDRVPLKSSLPHYTYGLTFNGSYKGFDASIIFQGVGKQYSVINSMQASGLNYNWLNFPTLIQGKYWSPYNTEEQNAKAIYPRLTEKNRGANFTMSDYWLYNNHYLRCKNITLGYTIPKKYTEKFYVQRLRLYIAASDLFCFKNSPKGWDPESSFWSYPIMKSIMFGLNLNF